MEWTVFRVRQFSIESVLCYAQIEYMRCRRIHDSDSKITWWSSLLRNLVIVLIKICHISLLSNTPEKNLNDVAERCVWPNPIVSVRYKDVHYWSSFPQSEMLCTCYQQTRLSDLDRSKGQDLLRWCTLHFSSFNTWNRNGKQNWSKYRNNHLQIFSYFHLKKNTKIFRSLRIEVRWAIRITKICSSCFGPLISFYSKIECSLLLSDRLGQCDSGSSYIRD